MASGYVDFPDYMKEVHEDWVHNASDTVTSSITDLINSAISASPYDSKTAFDPGTKLTAMMTAVTAFNTRVDAMNPTTDVTGAITAAKASVDGIVDDTYFEDYATELYNYMEDQINNVTIPTFKSGMRDVNAAISSSFVMGEALIRSFALRDVNKMVGDLKGKYQLAKLDLVFRGADRIVQNIMAQIELEKAVAHYTVEVNRLGIAAEKEQDDQDLAIAIGQEKWAFDAFQYGANIMASISGGTAYANTDTSAPSQTQSSIGGALAGAAIGSQLSGNWQGAAVGGLIGLGLSFL